MSSRPLEGIRVLEIAAYISGPYAGAILAALGAEVVKIEPPEGDAFRIGRGTGSPFFTQYNAGKKSVVVNLKSPDGVALVKSMLPKFDVLIENMRPGKLAALGLGPDACWAENPELICASVSGFGSGGPWADRPAYDSIGQALGGFYTVMNDAENVRLTGTCIADLITAINTTLGILASLVGRMRKADGKGVHIETSVFEAVTTLTIDAMTQALDTDIDPIRETRHPQAQNFCLKTASGGYIVMHLSSSQKFWRGLMKAVGRPEVAEDPLFATYASRTEPANFAMIKAMLEGEFAKLPRDEWEKRLIEADVPFSPALTMREVISHPQMQWLGVLGEEAAGHRLVNPPWRMDGQRPQRMPHVPQIGEDTQSVLSEFVDSARLAELVAGGAVVLPEPVE
jgi:formyl-CoA transferase